MACEFQSAVYHPLRDGLCDVLAPYPVALVVRVDPVSSPVAVRSPPGGVWAIGLGLGSGLGFGFGIGIGGLSQ